MTIHLPEDVENSINAGFLARHAKVGVDQNAQHAQRLVVLDETHAAHVGRQIVNNINAADRVFACRFLAQIQVPILNIREKLIPLIQRFYIDRAHLFALPTKVSDQMSADETSGAANYDFTRHRNVTKVTEVTRLQWSASGVRVASSSFSTPATALPLAR